MKSISLFFLFTMINIAVHAQNIMVIEQNDNTIKEFKIEDIKQIYFKKITSDSLTTEPFNRTVLIYIAGDNSLAEFINSDLQEIIEGSKSISNNEHRLMAFIDKRGEKPYICEITLGELKKVKTFDQELNSGDPQTLQTALKWVMDFFPSLSYGLVLWGHSDGWILRNDVVENRAPRRAFGIDNTAGRSWMDIPQMATALSSLPRLKFIFADCCAFQCVESAYELRNCADYIIASPAEIPGEGAPYHTVVPAMFDKADDFYKGIVDAYFDQTSYGYKLPLSVVKTDEMENLAFTTKTALSSFVPNLENSGRYPDVEGLIYYYDHTQFDMQDFMLRYTDASQYANWKKVFDQTVVYKKMASVWIANHVRYNNNYYEFKDFIVTEERYGGLGMFVPQDVSTITAPEYQPNRLTFSIEALNTNIRKMQWYNAAGLNEVGW